MLPNCLVKSVMECIRDIIVPSSNLIFTMMLCINRYESYTKASLRSFQTSGKVLKH